MPPLSRLLPTTLATALTATVAFGTLAAVPAFADTTPPAATPPAPSQPGTPAPVTPLTGSVTLKLPTTVAAGKSSTVRGTLVALPTTGPTTAVPTAPVTLRWRTVGTTRWSSRTVTTTTKGAWSTTLKLQTNSEVQARYAGTSGVTAASSPIGRVTATQAVSISKLSPKRPAIGQKLTVSGVTSNALRGTTVTVQRLRNGVWTTAATAKVSATGSYAAKLKVRSSASLTLRTRSIATAAITRATSARRTVGVAVTATLYPGQTLGAGRVLTSPNGLYSATVGSNGDLAVTDTAGNVLWHSNTTGSAPSLALTSTGNVVLRGSTGVLWQSGSTGAVPRLVMQNDGSLVLFSLGASRWSSTLGLGGSVRPAACWSTSFDCISYTGYNPAISYWRMYAGHNCTNYVAYRLTLAGVKNPPWGYPGGSAWQWRAGAKKKGFAVNTTPAVGAVMQWGRNTPGGGSSGHVVYVEQVTSTGVWISEDSWSGHASYRFIASTSSAFTSARFLHIKDAA
ncbi:surface antigen [Friedmanniella endophytica]|uniref:Surface antigen n=1 Tax=Microlunatus kandeliicorticis TaxID=1759536 RepID=A0A7W3IR85_9ACTN|nr:CHAP domain-containing protein [Microlunatus kandeliicorticis]MBA8793730.1 surface antigen [Microlunatus kandeliicorticis]